MRGEAGLASLGASPSSHSGRPACLLSLSLRFAIGVLGDPAGVSGSHLVTDEPFPPQGTSALSPIGAGTEQIIPKASHGPDGSRSPEGADGPVPLSCPPVLREGPSGATSGTTTDVASAITQLTV